MIKLQWLCINKFRRVKPGTRLNFNSGYNVLLGQNGTGKTTLLSLVSAVINSKFSDFADEEFELEYEFTIGENKVRFLTRNEKRPSALEVGNQSEQKLLEWADRFLRKNNASPSPNVFSSEAEVYFNSLQPLLRFVMREDGGIVFPDESISKNTSTGIPFKVAHDIDGISTDMVGGILSWFKFCYPALEGSLQDPADSYMHAVMQDDLKKNLLFMVLDFLSLDVRRFDESLEYFSGLSGGDVDVALELQNVSVSGSTRLPLSVSEKLADAVRAGWGGMRYTLNEKQLPFLGRLVGLLGFESAEAVFEFERISQEGRTESLKAGSQRFFFAHGGGWRISDKHLSYGQKRMLAFMYYLEFSEHVAIVDELVNGLHHNWIQACIEELDQRQVFLTSQNPLLLDYLNFESPKDVRSRFVLCRWEQDTKQMVWENMSQEAAEDFFASYKVGFQQVGELLQAKGLW